MKQTRLLLIALCTALFGPASADELLTGHAIGILPCVDYTTNSQTLEVNTYANAFDGVDHNRLWKILKETKLIVLLKTKLVISQFFASPKKMFILNSKH